MTAHVSAQLGGDGNAAADREKFVPRTNNDKAEYEAWLQKQKAKEQEEKPKAAGRVPYTHRAMLTSGGANGAQHQ